MNKAEETINLPFGTIPRYQDCTRCHAPLACSWGKFTYNQPCIDCQNTDEWQMEQEELARKPKERSQDEMMTINQPTAVYEFKGRNLYINKKGNIIKDEKWKPLKPGK